MLGSAEKVLVSIRTNKPAYSRAPFIFDVISVALLLAAMAGLFYLYRMQQHEQDLNKASAAVLSQAKAIVRAELDSVAADGLLLASDMSDSGMTDTFKKLMQLRPNYRQIAMIDRNGRTVVKVMRLEAEPVAIGIDELSSEPIVPPEHRGLAAGPGGLYASTPTIETDENGRGDHRLIIYFTVPLFGEYLTRQGAIVIGYDVDGLLATVRAITLAPRGHFDLVDDAGKSLDSAGRAGLVHSDQYVWTTDIPVTSSGAPHEGQLRLHYHLDEDAVAFDKRAQALWAFAFWLIALGPTAGLLCLARGARASDRAAQAALAQSEERLLEAEDLARIGHWRWQSKEAVLVLSPQAATMLGCPPGHQHKNLHESTALNSLEDGQHFIDRVRHVMDTGEISSADVRVVTMRGDRWLHSIIRPALDAAGNIVGAFGTLQDISARKKLEEELRALKTDYAALLDHLPVGVMYMDLDGRLGLVSEGLLRITGAARDRFEGRHYLEAVQHKDAEQLLKENFEIIRSETPQFGRVRCAVVRNETRWFRVDKIPRRDARGKVIGLVIVIADITSLKTAEQQLRALTVEHEKMLNRIPAGVIYKATDGRIIRANRVAARFAGISVEAMVGRRLDEIYPQGDHDVAHRIYEEVTRTGEPRLKVPVSGKMTDGSTRWFEIDVFPDFDVNGDVSGMIVFGVDITRRKQVEEQIAYLAMHDPLTDLCNRRLLTDRLTQALAHCERRQRHCALLFIDLDRFKSVNDLHGHDIGDVLLVQVAQRLRSCVRAEDTLARIGGDEFVILLSDTSGASDALTMAEKVRAALGPPFALRGISVEIGCSIGIAGFPEHGRTGLELMREADTAMYTAKAAGRSTACVSSSNIIPARHDAA